ncbi:MAG: N4-gp56 family major capsid protein [Bacteroidaceae bacterium]|nr:N4-gp56 family major capsid protein [Bacteroidaceae bacterium]
MAATSNATLLQDLFVPEVVADAIDKKLVDAIRFAPLAVIDTTLVGRAGDELTMPAYEYIGDAAAVAEGADIPVAKLTEDVAKVKVSKVGKAVEFSDEALISGANNDIAEEAAKQVVLAVNSKLEADLINAMSTTATLTAALDLGAENVAHEIAGAIAKFGEDMDGEKVLLVSTDVYLKLMKADGWVPNTEAGAKILMSGVVGSIFGAQVVISNRLTAKKEAYIVKPGALRIVMKRNTLGEFDRDILSEMNYIKASKLFAPYVYDKTKLVKISVTGA